MLGIPYRIRTISSNVCASGILSLQDIPNTEKKTIIGEHPAANQKGPASPKRYPTRVEPSIAVLQSHDYEAVSASEQQMQTYFRTEITADAVNPVRTFRLAVINL